MKRAIGTIVMMLSAAAAGGAAKPMPDGRKPHLHFRNEIVSGPGGSEILLDDPSGNPIERFQPSK